MSTRARLVLPALVAGLVLASCSATSSGSATPAGSTSGRGAAGTTTAVGPPCPVPAVPIVVSVDQWGDIVRRLAGACGDVTTIISGSSGDPHDYEPTPGDIAAFGRARLVVVNGAGYDAWAAKAVDALPSRPTVVDAADTVGWHEGDNPHLWYQPGDVARVVDDIEQALLRAAPGAVDEFGQRLAEWRHSKDAYDAAIADVKAKAAGRSYAATESVFDLLARDVGLTDVTPQGYANASANRSEPAPGDVNDFQNALREHRVDVLIFNAQTSGAVPDQLRRAAEDAGVPVVEVTETMPPGQPGFVAWQVDQLHRLAAALG